MRQAASTSVGLIRLADPAPPSTHDCCQISFLQCTEQTGIPTSLALATKAGLRIISHFAWELFTVLFASR
jgi:hypothetical protein